MLVNHQETRYTALFFFFNMRKKLEYQLLYCRIKKKKNPQLKAQQNK